MFNGELLSFRELFPCTRLILSPFFFSGMGYQYAGLLLSLVACLAIPLPYVLFIYGGESLPRKLTASSARH